MNLLPSVTVIWKCPTCGETLEEPIKESLEAMGPPRCVYCDPHQGEAFSMAYLGVIIPRAPRNQRMAKQ